MLLNIYVSKDCTSTLFLDSFIVLGLKTDVTVTSHSSGSLNRENFYTCNAIWTWSWKTTYLFVAMKYEVWAKSLLAGTKGKLVIRREICELGGLEVLITEQYEGQFTVSSWFSPRTSWVHLTTCVWGWSMVISKAEGKRGNERQTFSFSFVLQWSASPTHNIHDEWVNHKHGSSCAWLVRYLWAKLLASCL